MTALSMLIIWLAVRVTGVALLAAALAGWSARRAARSAVVVLSAAVMLCLALGAAALCPAPDFGRWSPLLLTPSSDETPAATARPPESATNHDAPLAGIAVARTWQLLSSLSSAPPESPVWRHGGTMVAVLYALGVAIAGLRLLFGWLAVRSLRRGSRPIRDAGLLHLADSLRRALGYSRRVELQECREPGLAATVGWWRPVILLPPEWTEWTEAERTAVLAHELAHIHHGDYLIILATHLCRAAYFYHPLVRWLSTQLRWQQELAADDLAASAVADRGLYLKALASLALRSPARMSATAMPWSAMTGGALLRRIHMLRGTAKSRPLGWAMRVFLIGMLAGTGMLLATLGSLATTPPAPSADDGAQPFEIGYLPPEAKGFIAFRPAFLLKQPGMDKVNQSIADMLKAAQKAGFTLPDQLKPENIEEIVANFNFHSEGTGKPGSRSLGVGGSSIYIRLKSDFDWPALFKSVSAQIKALTNEDFEVTELREDGVSIYHMSVLPMLGPLPVHFYMPDRRSIVFAGICRTAGDVQQSAETFRQSIGHVEAARQRDWGTGYKTVACAPIAAVLDNHDQHYVKMFAKDLDAEGLGLFQNIRFATLGIEVGDGRPVRLVLDAQSTAAAPDLEKAMDGFFRTSVDKIQQAKADYGPIMSKFVPELWQSRKKNRSGARIEWLGYSSVRLQHLIEDNAKEPPGPPAVSGPSGR